MKCSQRQIEVWQAREKLDKRLLKMTRKEMIDYLNGVVPRLEKKLGRKLDLKTARLQAREPSNV